MLNLQTDGLAHPSLDTVTHHGRTNSARNGETDPGAAGFRLAGAERHKERARELGTLLIDSAEIRGS